MKKRGKLFLDSALADMFSVPGICCVDRLIFSTARRRLSRHRRQTSAGSLADPLLMQQMTARLSDITQTDLPENKWPHTATVTTTGTSSLGAIVVLVHELGHSSSNQQLRHKAPQPQPPEAPLPEECGSRSTAGEKSPTSIALPWRLPGDGRDGPTLRLPTTCQ